ncbi:MAG: hypothetical protein UT21_C0011G0005 [Candidatus Woesebacteria bacterium GW2011_GWA1_39_11b]|nr:MAG: hypothetical protein UT21_C0011G0005 [Candidatus Woesebacteria bacterium GW2011_GWA1_39_11b]
MLENYLKKLGLTSFTELNAEERETYKEWESALHGRKITDKDVEDFLDAELDTAVSRLTEENLSVDAQAIRKAEVKLIKKIKLFLNGPATEKAFVERSIEQLSK